MKVKYNFKKQFYISNLGNIEINGTPYNKVKIIAKNHVMDQLLAIITILVLII